jgi:leucyl-tRNA synthetase
VPLPESLLPLKLPDIADFTPGAQVASQGQGAEAPIDAPLDRARNPDGSLWKDTRCPACGGPARRETNTMPQWAGSCWYYLRFLDPHNERQAWDPAKERYWMPVDLYVGGAEHAVLHLLYARFWHKVLHDLGLVSTAEPFRKLVNQGLILGEDHEKMSKSRGNVVNPDDIIKDHGADAFRLYEMFMGPLEAVKPWSTRSIEGIDRFLHRIWRLVVAGDGLNPALQGVPVEAALNRLLHETIKSVTEDLERLRFNTAISAMMIFLNALEGVVPAPRSAVETLVLLLAPFAPHLAEELWQRLGHPESLVYEAWPAYDPAALEQAEIVWVIQVDGRMRARLTLPVGASDEELRRAALSDERVKKFVDGQPVTQVIGVPGRLVNIVLSA